MLDRLVDERLVRLTEADDSDDALVEVAHEALIRNWPRLREWATAAWEQRFQRRRLIRASEEWQRRDRDPAALWRGSLLAEAETSIGLSTLELEFVQASRSTEDAAEQAGEQVVRALRTRLVVAIGATLVAVFLLGVVLYFAWLANKNEALARSRQLAAQARVVQDQRPDHALLLGLEALKAGLTREARGTILGALARNRKRVSYLWGPRSEVMGVSVGPDGKLTAGTRDGSVFLWDTVGGTPRQVTQVNDSSSVPMYSFAVSSDGRLFAYGDRSYRVRVWDAETGNLVGSPMDVDGLPQVTLSSDSSRLVISSSSGTIDVWDVTDRREPRRVHQWEEHLRIVSMALSADGTLLAASVDGEDDQDFGIRLWNIRDGTRLATLTGHTRSIRALAFSPDGSLLATAGNDTSIRLWRMVDLQGSELVSDDGPRWPIKSLAFSPGGELLVSGACGQTDASGVCVRGELRRWDVAHGVQLDMPILGHSHEILGIAISPDDATLVSGSADGTVILWTLDRLEPEMRRYGATSSVVSLAASANGSLLAAAGADSTITLWDMSERRRLKTVDTLRGPAAGLAVSPDGLLLAAGACANGKESCLGELRLFDLPAGTMHGEPLVVSDTKSARVHSLAFSPTLPLVAVAGSNDGSIVLWDVGSGRRLGELNGELSTRTLVFSPTGALLVSGHPHAVRLWDASQLKPVGSPWPVGKGELRSLALSQDGRVLASAGTNGWIQLWDMPDGRQPGRPKGAPFRGTKVDVTAIAFSRDGSRLATGSQDGTVILWDVASGEQLDRLSEPNHATVTGLVFVTIAGEERLVGAGSDLVEWRLAVPSPSLDDATLEIAICRLANRNLTTEEWKEANPGLDYRATCPNLPAPMDLGQGTED